MKARIGVLLSFCALSCGLSVTACSNLLYYPTRQLYVDPKKLDPQPEEKQFSLKDGLLIKGWYFHSPTPPKAIVLFFHGNGQNRSAQFLNLYWLIKRGFDLAIFDYPGYGQTGGKPSPYSTVQMARETIAYVHNLYPKIPLVIYGQSLGGAIAARAVCETKSEFVPARLVIDSSFTSYQKAGRKILAKSAWTWLFQPFAWIALSDRWAPGQCLKDLPNVPKVFIHSREDEIITFSQGEEGFEIAAEPKQFWVKEHGHHNGTYENEEGLKLREKLVEFLPH